MTEEQDLIVGVIETAYFDGKDTFQALCSLFELKHWRALPETVVVNHNWAIAIIEEKIRNGELING